MLPVVEEFCTDGFVAVRRAVPPDIVQRCVDTISKELRGRGVAPRDPATWTKPVMRIPCPEGPAFAAAGAAPKLAAWYDALLGPGRWIPHPGVGGTIPIRFPSRCDPGDAGWHIEGSYDVDGAWWVNVQSRGRGLLALFLFTDVGDDDAPTELIAGSHLDVPPILAPFGARGVFFGDVVGRLPRSTWKRPRVRATGRAGDVFLCHPFVVHRATWPHRGTQPRMVAQPAVATYEPFALRPDMPACAVERTVLDALARSAHPDRLPGVLHTSSVPE